MKQMSWLHVLLAAALVVAGGAALAFAAAPDVEKRVKVNINGDVESFQLEDFADGETRTFDAGAHTVTVTRNGDAGSWIFADDRPIQNRILFTLSAGSSRFG